MKRLYIVVEGQTEQEFVNSVAAPYLNKKGTHLYTLMYQYQNLCLDTYTKI